MISVEEDQRDLEKLYTGFADLVTARLVKEEEYAKLRKNIADEALACIEILQNTGISNKKVDSTIRRSKSNYKRYCAVIKGDEEFENKALSEIMPRLAAEIASVEARIMHNYRVSHPYSADKCIGNYLSTRNEIMDYMRETPRTYFNKKFKEQRKPDKQELEFIIDDRPVFVTRTGKCFHKLSCFQSRTPGRRITTIDDAVKSGYKPCSCIKEEIISGLVSGSILQRKDTGDNEKKGKMKVTDNTISEVTAFIDESCRINPWKAYEGNLPKEQTSISYIICQGRFDSESGITEENTMEKNACLARWGNNTTSAAVEAIYTVLETLAVKYSFQGAVRIFTDNIGAVKTWRKNDISKGLVSLFRDVRVIYVSRKKNKIADSIGRNRIFADISRDTMKKIEAAMHGENIEDDTLDYVEAFFPEPEKDLPKLVSDLENLSAAIGYLPRTSDPEAGEISSYGKIQTLLSSIRQGILAGASI